MITYVTYTHTDYINIAEIHAYYTARYNFNKILFINKVEDEKLKSYIDNILTYYYSKVVFYDDSLSYSDRIKQCLEQIDDEYILLMHDIDILIEADTNKLEMFFDFLKQNNYDRVDLKQTFNFSTSNIFEVDTKVKVLSKNIESDKLYLVGAESEHDYIYNVNPSIWKKESLYEIMSTFNNHSYREIEGMNTQLFCKKFKVFKLHSEKFLECGWFRCVPEFQFLHISHGGKLLPLNNEFVTPSGQSYVDLYQDYLEIYHTFDLKNIKLKHFVG